MLTTIARHEVIGYGSPLGYFFKCPVFEHGRCSDAGCAGRATAQRAGQAAFESFEALNRSAGQVANLAGARAGQGLRDVGAGLGDLKARAFAFYGGNRDRLKDAGQSACWDALQALAGGLAAVLDAACELAAAVASLPSAAPRGPIVAQLAICAAWIGRTMDEGDLARARTAMELAATLARAATDPGAAVDGVIHAVGDAAGAAQGAGQDAANAAGDAWHRAFG